MSDLFVFAMGCFISSLCVAFVVLSHRELKRLTRNAERRAEQNTGRVPGSARAALGSDGPGPASRS